MTADEILEPEKVMLVVDLVRGANQGGFGSGAVEMEEVVLHPYLYLLQVIVTGGEF